MLLDRAASEMNRLKFYIARAQDLPFIQNMEKRIQNASLLLDGPGHCLVTGLEYRDEIAIFNCLRAYAAIDNMRNAEEIFRATIVAPMVQKIIPHGPRGRLFLMDLGRFLDKMVVNCWKMIINNLSRALRKDAGSYWGFCQTSAGIIIKKQYT